jgi:hypothetical protein
VGGQIGAMWCGSWWFSKRYVKQSEDDVNFDPIASGRRQSNTEQGVGSDQMLNVTEEVG